MADDVDPGTTYAHSDAWQSWFPDEPDNTIAYNVRVTNSHYQGIMCRTGKADAPVAKDVAFVNCLIELRPPIRPPYRGIEYLMQWTDRFANCSAESAAIYVGERTQHDRQVCSRFGFDREVPVSVRPIGGFTRRQTTGAL